MSYRRHVVINEFCKWLQTSTGIFSEVISFKIVQSSNLFNPNLLIFIFLILLFKPPLNILGWDSAHSFYFLSPSLARSHAKVLGPAIAARHKLSCCTFTHYEPIFIAVLQGRGSPDACWLVLPGWPVFKQRQRLCTGQLQWEGQSANISTCTFSLLPSPHFFKH